MSDLSPTCPPKRTPTDVYKFVGLRPHGFMPQNGELFNNLNLICPVQFDFQKYSGSRATQINSISIAVPPHRGAARMRWTRMALRTNGAIADGEVVWPHRPIGADTQSD
jgi:hypothetical protein